MSELSKRDLIIEEARRVVSEPEPIVVLPPPSPRWSSRFVPAAQAVSFYDTPAWLELRYRALTVHGAYCQCCGAGAAPGHPLHVDHIKPRSKFPEFELDFDNLQVLCKSCNMGKGAWDQTDWRPRR
jgi:5-methylcytosine-specific restriction endonuclease McrA